MNKRIVVIRCKAVLPGFIFVPCYCEVFIADELEDARRAKGGAE